uniref:ZZ-type domain-containing protein n=1 Tax=Anopheles triannulatus TaxID=58253 RepID=A0A2M4A2G7_9DIPT
MNRHLSSIDMKVTVVHKTYREHYMLFRGQVPNSLSGLLVETKDRMIRSASPIVEQLNESFSGGCWMGRINWIDKHGDEILLVDNGDYQSYIHSIKRGGQGIMIIRVASTKPEPDETLKQIPIKYCFDSSVPAGPSVAPEILLARQMSQGSGMSLPDPSTLPLHKNVVCDVCDSEIRGHRYKCMTCQNYDLCMSCEGKYRHKEHMMLRLPTPDIRGYGAYSVFDKLRQFVTKMTPLVTGEETSPSSPTGAAGRAPKADHTTFNNNQDSSSKHGCRHPFANISIMVDGKKMMFKEFTEQHQKEAKKSHNKDPKPEQTNEDVKKPEPTKPSECEEKSTSFVNLIEALNSVAKQELSSKHDANNANGSANEKGGKHIDKSNASSEEDESTDELWTVLDGWHGSNTPEEGSVKLDSPGPSGTSAAKIKTEPSTPPKEPTDDTAKPPNRSSPDVKSKMNQLTELVTAAVLEGTRLMSVPSPERPVPPPTIQDDLNDDDENAARVDGAERKASDTSSTTDAATKASSGSDKSDTTNKVYSELPHVNHAIHMLITMGFSNENGWLTRLVESLDGDIPKALDLLLLQPSATNNSPRS